MKKCYGIVGYFHGVLILVILVVDPGAICPAHVQGGEHSNEFLGKASIIAKCKSNYLTAYRCLGLSARYSSAARRAMNIVETNCFSQI